MVYLSFFVCIVALGLLSYSTYAWFTSSATVNGSKIAGGNLSIELIKEKQRFILQKKQNVRIYTRKIGNEEIEYEAASDSQDVKIFIDKVEPGQKYPTDLYVLNSGELAATYSVAFELEVDDDGHKASYTGLETVEREYRLGDISEEEYNAVKRELRRKQIDSEGNDIGGHLEDVIQVYIGEESDDVIESNYVGTLSQIMEGEIQSYTGYLLPRKEVLNDEGFIIPRNVDIVDNDGNILRTEENVTEIGPLKFLLYIPEDTSSLYEYASIRFKIGATATQVEYEKDGFGYMIYDESARPGSSLYPRPATTDATVKYKDEETRTIKSKKLPTGTAIIIDPDIGTITGETNVTLTDRQIINLNTDSYIPTPPSGKVFRGYTYFEDGNKFVAQYEDIETYTVTFHSLGNVPSQTVNDEDKVIRPEDPTSTDYVFKGWYKEQDCNTPWDFENDIVTSDVTIYAKWVDKFVDNVLSVNTLYDNGERGLREDDIVQVNGVDCYVLMVDETNERAELITKDIYDIRFDEGGHTSQEVDGAITSGQDYQGYTYNYKYSSLKQWNDSFLTNYLGNDSHIIETPIVAYYNNTNESNFDNYNYSELQQKVFTLDTYEAMDYASKFNWNPENHFFNNTEINVTGFWLNAGLNDLERPRVFVVKNDGELSFEYANVEQIGARPVFYVSVDEIHFDS